MDLIAATAEGISLKTTKAWPRILRVLRATISRIWPNWEKIAYNDFFKSAMEKYVLDLRWLRFVVTLAFFLHFFVKIVNVYGMIWTLHCVFYLFANVYGLEFRPAFLLLAFSRWEFENMSNLFGHFYANPMVDLFEHWAHIWPKRMGLGQNWTLPLLFKSIRNSRKIKHI